MSIPNVTRAQIEALRTEREDAEWYAKHTTGHVLLVGPPGTGKSTLAAAAARNGQQVYTCNGAANSSKFDFWGTPNMSSGEWQPGPAYNAWSTGGLLVVNDVHLYDDEVLSELMLLLEPVGTVQAIKHLPNGEVLTPAKGYRAALTSNEPPAWFSEPIQSRVRVVNVTYPSLEALAQLPADLRAACERVYAAAANGNGKPTYEFREFGQYATDRRHLLRALAAEQGTTADKLSPEQVSRVQFMAARGALLGDAQRARDFLLALSINATAHATTARKA